jgi:hypothetical protein
MDTRFVATLSVVGRLVHTIQPFQAPGTERVVGDRRDRRYWVSPFEDRRSSSMEHRPGRYNGIDYRNDASPANDSTPFILDRLCETSQSGHTK